MRLLISLCGTTNLKVTTAIREMIIIIKSCIISDRLTLVNSLDDGRHRAVNMSTQLWRHTIENSSSDYKQSQKVDSLPHQEFLVNGCQQSIPYESKSKKENRLRFWIASAVATNSRSAWPHFVLFIFDCLVARSLTAFIVADRFRSTDGWWGEQ
jgi:hypothetical protein